MVLSAIELGEMVIFRSSSSKSVWLFLIFSNLSFVDAMLAPPIRSGVGQSGSLPLSDVSSIFIASCLLLFFRDVRNTRPSNNDHDREIETAN